MATKITVTYRDDNYILEYSRFTASAIEKQGFVLDDLTTKPNIMIPLLVHGAFLKHHRDLKQKNIYEIYEHIVIKPEPYTKELYPTTYAELREREEREAKAKEERFKAEFTAFVERMRKKSNTP